MVISVLILWAFLTAFCGFFYFLWNEPVIAMLLMTISVITIAVYNILDERIE
jgi:hypothetical protein